MLHNFRTEPIEGKPICEKVFIDNLCVQCSGYTIRHSCGNVPRVTIEMSIIPSLDTNAEIKIANLSEIATVMDEDTFKAFKKIWSEIHN